MARGKGRSTDVVWMAFLLGSACRNFQKFNVGRRPIGVDCGIHHKDTKAQKGQKEKYDEDGYDSEWLKVAQCLSSRELVSAGRYFQLFTFGHSVL
jgi:hypothetical protein